MTTPPAPTRRNLLRWVGWFTAANIGLFMLVGLRYLLVYPFSADLAGNVYIALAYTGQMALLASLPIGLLLVPFAILIPRKGFIFTLGVLLASGALALLILDTNVFNANRFHLSLLSAALFEWSTWLFAGLLLLILLFFQALLAGAVWRNFAVWPGTRRGGWLALLLVLAWLGGTGFHIWGDAVGHTPVTQFTRYMPLYFPIHAKRDLARLGWVDPEAAQRRRQLQGGLEPGQGQLDYPQHPLDCEQPRPALNLLVILVDGMRPDVIGPRLTPQLAAFRARSIDFRRHYSGGNSSRMGFFSFFYGLPSTYWESFYDSQRPPVLINQLRAAGYELSLHSAIGFGSPTLIDRTVFAGIPDLPGHEGGGALAINEAATRSFQDWLTNAYQGQPFFGFVYYDPPMAVMPTEGVEPLPGDERFQANSEARKAWHQYRLAMRFIDTQVGKLLAALEARDLQNDTVIMVTSDHGYEFDDNGLGYVGHASSFSAAQLRATLLMRWPGREAAIVERRTAHEDVPVTLLQDLLGCRNPPEDYALGRNLFSGASWDWIIAGSYTEYAIVQPSQVTVSYPGGFVEVRDDRYRPIDRSNLDPAVVQASMQAMRRYFR